jgi:hypothetical protein
MTVARRLAAILAVDVAGYSRLVREDESGTARAVKEHRACRQFWVCAWEKGRLSQRN